MTYSVQAQYTIYHLTIDEKYYTYAETSFQNASEWTKSLIT